MVDKVLILRKITELEEYIRQLKEFSNITIQEYKKDWKIQRIIERTLQIIIEVCTDIANHIISDRNYRVPKSYADTFNVLFEENLIEEPLTETMKKITGFRNILVHHYDKLDGSVIIGIIKNDLDDFLDYRDVILSLLKKSE